MAKIKLGMIVVEMRGKLGGHVFAKNRGGAYVRTKITPVNPQTAFQAAVRAIFSAISQAWSGLTQDQRNSWNTKVSLYATTDVFGDSKNPSGKELHQRLNENLLNSGQTIIANAPSPLPVPTGVLSELDFLIGLGLNVNTLGDSTGSKMQVFATPPVSAGTEFVKNKLRLLESVQGTNDATADIIGSFTQRYGAPVEGDKIFVGVKFVNAQGQSSSMQVLSGVATT